MLEYACATSQACAYAQPSGPDAHSRFAHLASVTDDDGA